MDLWEKMTSKEKSDFLEKLSLEEKMKLVRNNLSLVPKKKSSPAEQPGEKEKREKSVAELDEELEVLGRKVALEADNAIFAARTPLLCYHLSRGELWQVVQKYLKFKINFSITVSR